MKESNVSDPIVFKYCAILAGIVGVVTNGVVLAALLSKDRKRKMANIFIINQVTLDLYSTAFLLVTYAMKLHVSSLQFVGTFGWILCTVFDSGMIIFNGLTGSMVNLVLIAAEWYFLIAHPVLHKTQVKRWLIIALGTLPWIEGVSGGSRNLDQGCVKNLRNSGQSRQYFQGRINHVANVSVKRAYSQNINFTGLL